jgi:hypothetical protein
MKTKLTLTMDDEVVLKAKNYARGTGRSLSGLVEHYLKRLGSDNDATNDFEVTPLVKKMKGSFQAPANFNYKKELSKALDNKYLKE